MPPPGNRHFLDAVAKLFGSEEGSDCVIRFCQETDVLGPKEKKQKTNEAVTSFGAGAAGGSEGGAYIGSPLPAHRFVLCYSSERFSAQFKRWDSGEQAPPASSVNPSSSTSSITPHPELRIPLGSEEEVDSACAAIRFAYTGEVQAGSMREVLEVRRQAAYLQIAGCAEACDEVLRGMMVAAAAAQGDDGGAAAQGDPTEQQEAVLEFYACAALWPDHSLEAVVAAAKQPLVSYFGNTLRVLNTPSLRQQLLDLPAVAVEALLDSDSFGTDSESSVLLLLATWMEVNYNKTDVETRERLCRRVRLVQLSKPYLSFVLPALALDYEMTPRTRAGWFPVSVPEAAFISHFAGASDEEKKRMLEVSPTYGIHSATYNTKPREQCVAEGGLSFAGHITQRKLVEKLATLQPGETAEVVWTMEQQPVVCAQGFLWVVSIQWSHGDPSAGLFLHCCKPYAYTTLNPRRFNGPVPMLVSMCSLLTVDRWSNGARAGSVLFEYDMQDLVSTGCAWGDISVLPLKQLEGPAGAGGGGGGGGAGAVGGPEAGGNQVLAAWEEYLHEGKITGSLTLLPTPPAAGEEEE